jgi:hypothetical protein
LHGHCGGRTSARVSDPRWRGYWKLYHAHGVVFGEALVEATQLEARTAVYPRIVLSPTAARPMADISSSIFFGTKDEDGIYCLNYIERLLFFSATPGNDWHKDIKQWFDDVVVVIGSNLDRLEREEKLNPWAKWTWFAKRFRAAIDRQADALNQIGISMSAVPWGR